MTSPTRRSHIVCSIAVVTIGVSCSGDSEDPYLARRSTFETTLVNIGPPPGGSEPAMYGDWAPAAENVTEVLYRSGDLELKAWLYVPSEARTEPAHALLYLGGGSEVGDYTLPNTKMFIDSGFVVMVPALRGANGNPGNYEHEFGEVDDAVAAVRWLADQETVNRDFVYVLGLSAGGAVAAMMSLWDDVPARRIASIGGLFDRTLTSVVPDIAPLLPFDTTDATEWDMRSLVGNLRWMQRPHLAIVGSEDRLVASAVERAYREMETIDAPLEIVHLPGDHFGMRWQVAQQMLMDRIFDDMTHN